MNFEFIEDTYDYRYENINIDRTVEINCNIDSLEFKYKLFKFFFCFSQETKLNLFQMKYKICLVLYLKKLLFMCNPFYKKKYIFYREEKSFLLTLFNAFSLFTNSIVYIYLFYLVYIYNHYLSSLHLYLLSI